jgi:hypothetical protein
VNCLPGLALNRGPPDLCLLSGWDYRHGHSTRPFKINLELCRQPWEQQAVAAEMVGDAVTALK